MFLCINELIHYEVMNLVLLDYSLQPWYNKDLASKMLHPS